MPNVCRNILVVEGDPIALKEFKHRVQSEDVDEETGKRYVLGFERHVPPPSDLSRDGHPKEGELFPDWYTWRVENWGTKWNAAYPTRSGTLKSGCLKYRFTTAYGPPIPWLDVVAREHPKLDFTLEFQEEFDQLSGWMQWRRGDFKAQDVFAMYQGRLKQGRRSHRRKRRPRHARNPA